MKFHNPLLPPPSADPWIIRHGDWYYFCRSKDNHIEVIKSPTITGVGKGERKNVWSPPTEGPFSKELWAPELHYLQGKWYIYFAADDGDNMNHRMWVLESVEDDPQGTYILKGQLKALTDKWAIDGTVLEMADGQLVFIWSGWPGDKNVTQVLYMAPMSNPWTISGERVLLSEPTYEWERHTYSGGPTVNEGPQALKHGNCIHIVYSASHSSIEAYCLGLLTFRGGDVLEPINWEKAAYPVLRKNPKAGVYSVGHCSFTVSPDGTEDWILYHAMTDPNGGWGNRSTRAQRFTWDADGKPIFEAPASLAKALDVPAGESIQATHEP